MAGLLVVRSRKVSAERQKGQVQGGNPNWGGRREHKRGLGYTRGLCLCYQSLPNTSTSGKRKGCFVGIDRNNT